jgi:hypothetical protein
MFRPLFIESILNEYRLTLSDSGCLPLFCEPLGMTLSSSEPRRRSIAVALAWCGAVLPLGSGIHKFYLGQPGWGMVYLLLGMTPLTIIPHIACALEGAWLLGRPPAFFGAEAAKSAPPAKPVPPIDPKQMNALGVALRELDRLRQEGLISEAEFEQKRRQLLDQVG